MLRLQAVERGDGGLIAGATLESEVLYGYDGVDTADWSDPRRRLGD
ncbi:MAG: hypothetical protein ACXW3D_04280 [Caulobacteraceae bacterium]